MTAPPMTREIGFNQQNYDPEAKMPIQQMQNIPMAAIQQQQMIPQYRQYAPQPMNFQGMMRQPNSQERNPSSTFQNLQPNVPQQQNLAKSHEETPTRTRMDSNKSLSSNNSNLSQQFQGLIMDHNETFLFQIIKQHDECPNPTQKLEFLKGNVHKLALTQTGSRFLQKQLTKANSNIVEFFLQEIGEHMPNLMVDNYGNYFCQKLLSSCSGDQRLNILKMIEKRFIEICCNKKGTHTIQTMFDLVNLPEEEEFIKGQIRGNVIQLAMDAQGTHVVQKVIQSFQESKRQFIFDEVYDKFTDLAMNTNGLCVVKRLVQNISNTEESKRLMYRIADNVIELVQNPFGNYAITEVINNWSVETCRPIFLQFRGRLSQLSIQKFSSNVIEKCLEKADSEIKSMFIEEIRTSDKLTSLIRNSYGNYVVQKALKISQGIDKQNLITSIQKCIPSIPDRKIRNKWEQIVQEALTGDSSSSKLNNKKTSNKRTSSEESK